MRFFAVFLTLILATPAEGDELYSDFRLGFAGTLGVTMEIDRLAALLTDEGLREVVCRVSSQRYSFGHLSSALGLPEGHVMRRIKTLRSWGLVRLVRRDSAVTIVEPMPGEGARTLRRWAERYCPTGDACGRPATGAQSEGHARTTRGPAGMGAPVEGDTRLQDKLVTVFGGAGFIGRDLVQHLLAAGARVRVASRNPDSSVFPPSLRDDKRFSTVKADARRGIGVDAAVADAHMAVNLIGIHSETDDLRFSDVNEIASRYIAAEAAAGRVERLVHVSNLSAELESRSMFARTKAAGEAAVREYFPMVTIVRPSFVLGTDGGFLERVLEVSRHTPVLPLIREGKPLFQPIYVGDVSEAIVRILSVPETKGRTFELGGPRTMTMRDMVAMATVEVGHEAPAKKLPKRIEAARAALLRTLPKSLREPEKEIPPGRDLVVSAHTLGLGDLGITPTPIEEVIAELHARL